MFGWRVVSEVGAGARWLARACRNGKYSPSYGVLHWQRSPTLGRHYHAGLSYEPEQLLQDWYCAGSRGPFAVDGCPVYWYKFQGICVEFLSTQRPGPLGRIGLHRAGVEGRESRAGSRR